MSFDSLLIKTCAIQLNTPTQNSYGQMIESWANIAGLTAVPCRLEVAGGGLVGTPREIYDSITHVLFMKEPSGITLNTENHRIVIDGDNYSILLVEKVYDSTGVHHLEVMLQKVT